MMDLDKLFEHEVFQSMAPERLGIFRRFADQTAGKSDREAMGLFLGLVQSLPKGEPLHPEERAAISTAIEESLSPGDREKFRNMAAMLARMGL